VAQYVIGIYHNCRSDFIEKVGGGFISARDIKKIKTVNQELPSGEKSFMGFFPSEIQVKLNTLRQSGRRTLLIVVALNFL
jgi:hypothetical protein